MGHVKPDHALHPDRRPRGGQRGRREPHVIDIDYFHFPSRIRDERRVGRGQQAASARSISTSSSKGRAPGRLRSRKSCGESPSFSHSPRRGRARTGRLSTSRCRSWISLNTSTALFMTTTSGITTCLPMRASSTNCFPTAIDCASFSPPTGESRGYSSAPTCQGSQAMAGAIREIEARTRVVAGVPGLRHRNFRNAQPHVGSDRGRTIAERVDRVRDDLPDALGALRLAARRLHRARAQPDPDPFFFSALWVGAASN